MPEREFNKRILDELTLTDESSLRFASSLGLISLHRESCPLCENGVLAIEKKGRLDHGVDGRWRCNQKACKYRRSLFAGSLFATTHLTMRQFFDLCYSYSQRLTLMNASIESSVDLNTVSKWYKNLDDYMIRGETHGRPKLGGFGHVVEVDEMHLFTRMHNRGRILRSQRFWV